MNVAIIENEEYTAENLIFLLKSIDSSIEISVVIKTVKESVEWLKNNTPDILFSDIELDDGPSFEIFEQVSVTCPIVFVTVFDQYAIQAFKLNSLDYLLKPVQKDELYQTLIKFYKNQREIAQVTDYKLQEAKSLIQNKTKKRFISRMGNVFNFVLVEDISFFHVDNVGTSLITWKNKKYYIDYNMDVLESVLDKSLFYRVNRSYIVHINSIEKFIRFSNRRLKIVLKNSEDEDIIMSREKVTDFKSWLNI